MTYMPSISLSEARAALPALLDRVGEGEEITITRHGVPVAVVVRPDALRVRRAASALEEAEALRNTLEQARSIAIHDAPVLEPAVADAYVADLRITRRSR
jgi:prevent-host-death family protein